MKQFRRLYYMMILLVGALLLTGCDKISFSTFDASKEEQNTEISPTGVDLDQMQSEKEDSESEDNQNGNADDSKDSKEVPGKAKPATPTPSSIQPTEHMDLSVYTVNFKSGDIEPVTASIPKDSKLDPKLIVNTVTESLADQSINIGIKDVTTKDDSIIVNFTKENPPSINLGSGYEDAILNAYAQSLLDNLNDYHKIIFRIDDKAYTSGAFEYGIDEVYLEE